ncbi:MAG: amidohydrolase [Planctomycetes bacterium]|nr:amidohydrolase [Planctomycetota bacterium]
MLRRIFLVAFLSVLPASALWAEGPGALAQEIDRLAREFEPKVIAWRRDFHQNPELGNREFRTAKVVAEHLRRLGLEVKTGVAHTGVVGLLRGGGPGPVVALRADMDALPVTETLDLPFRSQARVEYEGRQTGVMHACGHDAHTAILMGVAEVLAGLKSQIAGTVVFIFQPAEEGAPEGEEGGASLMIKEGVLESPRPDAIFALHTSTGHHTGKLAYRAGPVMAASDRLRIKVRGRQTHGAAPWSGVDPVVVASQIVLGLQTIVSRQMNLTKEPVVVTIGSIHGGNRNNIIPGEVEMEGTVRTFNQNMREEVHRRIKQTAEMIAAAAGASAEVQIREGYPVSVNDEGLTEKMLPTLKRCAGEKNVVLRDKSTGAEDFAFFQQKIPGFYYHLGVVPAGVDVKQAAPGHSDKFFVDEAALVMGVRSLANLAVDFLESAR